MKSLLYIYFTATFLVILGISSCDLFKDDEMTTGENCLLSQRSFDFPNDPAREDTYFEYNSDENLTEIRNVAYDLGSDAYTTRTALSYIGDMVEQVNTYSKFGSNTEERDFRYKFYYEGTEVDSVKVDGYNAYVNHDLYYLVEFSNNKLSQVREYRFNSTSQSYASTFVADVFWSGNNINKVESTNNMGNTSVFEYSYDDKKKTYGTIGLAFLNTDYAQLSANNVTKKTLTDSNGAVILDENYNYTYTSQGYPETSTLGGDYPVYNYSYDCK